MAPSALLAATMSPASPLLARQLSSVKTTFSSWDNCMAQVYCKWPAIAGIIIGSLIALSVLFCVVRCCCCGMECCCAACACMNACCPSPRGGKRTKYRDAAPPPPAMPHHGYQPTPAPYYAGPAVPQFATFDASKKIGADSLPPMPSWDTSTSKKVIDDTQPEEVEMDKMGQNDETRPMLGNGTPQAGAGGFPSPYQQGNSSTYSQTGFGNAAPVAAGALAAGALGQRAQAGSAQGYRGASGNHPGMPPSQNSYASTAQGSQGYVQGRPQQGYAAGTGYAQRSPGYAQSGSQQNVNTVYGSAAAAPSPQYAQVGYGRSQSPAYNSGYGNSRSEQQGYGGSRQGQQQDYDGYGYGDDQDQSYGVIPSAPQATYGGSQQEYSRPSGGVPSSLTPGSQPRANPYSGQQAYGGGQQNYTSYSGGGNGHGNQQQSWRDV